MRLPSALLLVLALLVNPWIESRADDLKIRAESLRYDPVSALYIATGSVGVIAEDGRRSLKADRLEYSTQSGTIHASGNVQLFLENGTVIVGEAIRTDDKLSKELMLEPRARDAKNARYAARVLIRTDQKSRRLENFIYTPCVDCPNRAQETPVWQLRAKEAVQDIEGKNYILRDSTLLLGGWPIFYTPYFQYPDSSVKRRSGLLQPSAGKSSRLGFYAVVPYFFDLDLDKNLTVTPTVSSRSTRILDLQYQQALNHGYLDLKTSLGKMEVTKGDGTQNVGHLEASFLLQYPNNIEYGGHIRHSSDPAYLSALKVRSSKFESLYQSDLYARFYSTPRDRIVLNAARFVDDRTLTSNSLAPRLIPQISGRYTSDHDRFAGRFVHRFDLKKVYQRSLTNSQSAVLNSEYSLETLYSPGITARYRLKGDVRLSNYTDALGIQKSDHQFFSRAVAIWRWPFLRRFEDATGILEPVITLKASPFSSMNNPDIPAYDTSPTGDSERLLLGLEQTSGSARQDDSTRVSLGLEYDHLNDSGQALNLLFGRSFFIDEASFSPTGQELRRYHHRLEDYSARVRLALPSGFSIQNKNTFKSLTRGVDSHEIDLSWPKVFPNTSASLSYAYRRVDPKANLTGLHQLVGNLTHKLDQYWQVSTDFHYDFEFPETGKRLRAADLKLSYSEECLNIVGFYSRKRYDSLSSPPDSSIGIKFKLEFG